MNMSGRLLDLFKLRAMDILTINININVNIIQIILDIAQINTSYDYFHKTVLL